MDFLRPLVANIRNLTGTPFNAGVLTKVCWGKGRCILLENDKSSKGEYRHLLGGLESKELWPECSIWCGGALGI